MGRWQHNARSVLFGKYGRKLKSIIQDPQRCHIWGIGLRREGQFQRNPHPSRRLLLRWRVERRFTPRQRQTQDRGRVLLRRSIHQWAQIRKRQVLFRQRYVWRNFRKRHVLRVRHYDPQRRKNHQRTLAKWSFRRERRNRLDIRIKVYGIFFEQLQRRRRDLLVLRWETVDWRVVQWSSKRVWVLSAPQRINCQRNLGSRSEERRDARDRRKQGEATLKFIFSLRYNTIFE